MRILTYPMLVLFLLMNCVISFSQQKITLPSHLGFSVGEKQISIDKSNLVQPPILDNFDLKYHRFNWIINPAVRYISGSVTSYFVATQPQMNTIQFQLGAGMSADSALFERKMTQVIHSGNVISISLSRVIHKGEIDSLTIYYHGVPTSSGFGSYNTSLHNGVPTMSTLSQPYGAADWWPSKNDLTDKIDSIDVFVIVPKGNHVASNGLLVSETPSGSNSTIAHWKHRYPIASYLIAVAVTNYARYTDYYKTGTDSIPILNYVYPEDSVVLRPITSDVVNTMALFERLFTPYPFKKEKYGHAECNMQGGMEHQTMTFLEKKSFAQYVLTHELSHHWFGDMITCGSWEDIWLNEGFATYCEGLSYEYLHTHDAWNNWIKALSSSVVSGDQGSVYCNDTTSVGRIFNSTLSYKKGAYMLVMLRGILGDKDFFQAIKNYLNDPQLKYGFAHTTDLKKQLEKQSGKDLTKFFAQWFYGTGLPIYDTHVKQQPGFGAVVTINQTQYKSNVAFFEMPLPIKFKGKNKDTTIVFNHTYSGQTFNINPGFKIDSVFFDPQKKLLYYSTQVSIDKTTNYDPEKTSKVIIAPNPAKDILHILNVTGDINFIHIFNAEGKSQNVLLTSQGNSLLELNIQQFQPGLYILQLGTSNRIEIKKFTVIK